MRDGEEAAPRGGAAARVAHVGVVARVEDVVGDAVVGGDEAAEADLELEDGAGHVGGFEGGGLEVEAEGYGGVGDAVDDGVGGGLRGGGGGVEGSRGWW